MSNEELRAALRNERALNDAARVYIAQLKATLEVVADERDAMERECEAREFMAECSAVARFAAMSVATN